MKRMKRYPVCLGVFENVPQHPISLLTPLQSVYDIQEVFLDAQQFGWPVSRKRVYRLLINKTQRRWCVQARWASRLDNKF